jgi:quercetin 2,3-dioxygenase
MLQIRPATDRGHTVTDWLSSYHSFSFGDYYDPYHKGFGHLRVINDDLINPGKGFATHHHYDMEIITYVLSGALEHKDSLGNGSVIRAGDVQRMSAGTGVAHSEFNPSDTDSGHFLQIWILPEQTGLPPSYEQKHFPTEEKKGKLCLIASRDGRNGSLQIHQDAQVHASVLDEGQQVTFMPDPERRLWVQVATGELHVNHVPLSVWQGMGLNDRILYAGDGAGMADIAEVIFTGLRPGTEFLLFDLSQ